MERSHAASFSPAKRRTQKSQLAAVVWGSAGRQVTVGVEAETAELARDAVADARLRARYEVAARYGRMLHDVALNPLLALTRPGQQDSALMREQCGIAARQIRERLDVTLSAYGAPASCVGAVRAALARVAGLDVELVLDAGIEGAVLGPVVLAAVDGALAELLTNIRRHSGQTSARVTVGRTDRDFVITVRDDGRGFDPSFIPSGKLGLRRSVVDRITDVGGEAAVCSRPGHGTTSTITCPLLSGARATDHGASPASAIGSLAAGAASGMRAGAAEHAAAELLQAIADGGIDVSASATRHRAALVHTRLRTDLALRLGQSLLQAILYEEVAAAHADGRMLVVHDPDNLGSRLHTEHRVALVRAVRDVAASDLLVDVAPATTIGRAHVVLRAEGARPPETGGWRLLRAVCVGHLTASAGRWFFDFELPTRARAA